MNEEEILIIANGEDKTKEIESIVQKENGTVYVNSVKTNGQTGSIVRIYD